MANDQSKEKSSKNTQETTGRQGGDSKDSPAKERFELFRVQFHEPVGNMQFALPEQIEYIDENAQAVGLKFQQNRFIVPFTNVRYIHFIDKNKDE